MISTLKFRCRAYDTYHAPPGTRIEASIPLFEGSGPESDEKVTDKSEKQIVDWLVGTQSARELLLEELGLPANTYVRTNIKRPLVERNRQKPPGDIDLVLVTDPRHAIAIQIKRVRVEAETTDSDRMLGDHAEVIARLIEQTNCSIELGFHADYALILIECCGARRTEHNILFRNTSPEFFNKKIYSVRKDQPIHNDVGVIFLEVAQTTSASMDKAGMVCVCEDKRAVRRDQKPEMTTRVEKLVQSWVTMGAQPSTIEAR